jgi:CBS domain-containing protein
MPAKLNHTIESMDESSNRRIPAMMCRDLMKTDVECVSPKTAVVQAATQMKQANVGFLPVCDEVTHRVLGTITDRDIVVRVVAAGESLREPIERFFTRRVVGVRSTDTLQEAQKLMGQEKVSRILCLGGNDKLEGVISLSDIAQVEEGRRASATLRDISEREVRM